MRQASRYGEPSRAAARVEAAVAFSIGRAGEPSCTASPGWVGSPLAAGRFLESVP